MRFVTALSTIFSTSSALDELLDELRVGLEGEAPDLIWVNFTPHHGGEAERILMRLRLEWPKVLCIGGLASGVLSGGVELEQGPGLMLFAACLPGASLHAFHLSDGLLPGRDGTAGDWETAVGVAAREVNGLLVLGDPFWAYHQRALNGLAQAYPGAVVAGGVVSGATDAGSSVMLCGGDVWREGMVGVAIGGDVGLSALVSQGCRPVGAPLFVTAVRGTRVLGLDGLRPVDALKGVYEALEPRDQVHFRKALFVGVQMREQDEYGAGDFLVRSVHGVDRGDGALVVGARPQQYEVVQLHVRDRNSASAALAASIDAWVPTHSSAPEGLLLFSCISRGQALFDVPAHDSSMVRSRMPGATLAGMFCSGEIGPVGDQSWLHGVSAVLVGFVPV